MKKGVIKNYSTSVPMERTILEIERELVKIGATGIEKTYEGGVPVGLLFRVDIPDKGPASFKVPANTKAVAEIMFGKHIREKQEAQALRTAWRIVLNWVQIQVVMVQMAQVEVLQIFLPYAYNKLTEMTFFQTIKNSEYRLLLNAPTKEKP